MTALGVMPRSGMRRLHGIDIERARRQMVDMRPLED